MVFYLRMEIQAVVCLICILFAVTECSPSRLFEEYAATTPAPIEENLNRAKVDSEQDAVSYLEQFGYVGKDSEDPRTASIRHRGALEAALKNFQRMAGIPQTGVLDEETKTMMSLPRCGVKDTDKSKRMKRYTLNGSKWDRSRLTYKINSFTNDLPKDMTKTIFDKAFKIWADVSSLTFEKRESSTADIEIEFAVGEHGDGNPFDGPGKTLAHAFFPVYGGDAHFDDAETFTDGEHRGANLFQVAAHEFGHSLGLSHSENKDALMAPFYRGYVPNYRLHSDDVAAIQALYGPNAPATQRPPVAEATTTPRGGGPAPRPTPEPPVGACSGQFDAIASAKTSFGVSITIAFTGNKYYILTNGKPEPKNIKDLFTQIDRVDAAIATSRGSTIYLYLFKDSQLYKYTLTVQSNSRMQLSFAGRGTISRSIKGLPDNIDAIFSWGRNDNIYAFKDKQYWRVSGTSVVDGYPRPISNWRLPSSVDKVDAVVKYSNGRTYFFVGQNYYRYDDGNLRVSSGYPRSIGEWWLDCPMGSIKTTQEENTQEDEAKPEAAAQGSDMREDDDTFIRVKTTLQLEEEGTSGARPGGVGAVSTVLSMLAVVVLQRFF